MREYHIGDIVGWESPEYGYVYGRVVDITEDELTAEDFDDEWKTYWIRKDDADLYKTVYVTLGDAVRFARYEITAQELIKDVYPPQRVQTRHPYCVTVGDLTAALRKASDVPAERFREEWFAPITGILYESFLTMDLQTGEEDADRYRFLPSEGYWVSEALNAAGEIMDGGSSDYSEVIAKLESVQEQLRLPVPERQYDDDVKTRYIRCFDNGDMLKKATDAELALFVRYVEELCEKNVKTALHAKAYGCYGGNRAFPCDWTASRDCLLKLCEIDDNPFYANTLGYIYYYGRCTDGEPDHEKAFYYFSVGAAGGVYESRYKLADMFLHGYGTPRNERIASSIIRELYDENLRYICGGDFSSKFADLALRMGNLYRDGVGRDADPYLAFYCYLQAEYAVRMRMSSGDFYGDAKVADSIRKAIGEILPLTGFEKPKRKVRYRDVMAFISHISRPNIPMRAKIRKTESGEYSLRLSMPAGDWGEKYRKMFVTEPKAHFCGPLDRLTVKTVGCRKIKIGGRLLREGSAEVIFDRADGDELYLFGKKVAEIGCKEYTVVYPRREKSRTVRFASVTFQKGGKTYDYLCDLPDVQTGDRAVVETDRGETEVEVVRVFEQDAAETALPIGKYRKILRKATQE